jgi:hypothetical protein
MNQYRNWQGSVPEIKPNCEYHPKLPAIRVETDLATNIISREKDAQSIGLR